MEDDLSDATIVRLAKDNGEVSPIIIESKSELKDGNDANSKATGQIEVKSKVKELARIAQNKIDEHRGHQSKRADVKNYVKNSIDDRKAKKILAREEYRRDNPGSADWSDVEVDRIIRLLADDTRVSVSGATSEQGDLSEKVEQEDLPVKSDVSDFAEITEERGDVSDGDEFVLSTVKDWDNALRVDDDDVSSVDSDIEEIHVGLQAATGQRSPRSEQASGLLLKKYGDEEAIDVEKYGEDEEPKDVEKYGEDEEAINDMVDVVIEESSEVKPLPTQDQLPAVLFTNERPVYFSRFKEGTFERKWTAWKHVLFSIHSEGFIHYNSLRSPGRIKKIDFKQIDNLEILKIPIATNFAEAAVLVRGRRDETELAFRFILSQQELHPFHNALKSMSPNLLDDSFKASMNWVEADAANSKTSSAHQQISAEIREAYLSELHASIVSKRRAFAWLPAYFTSDLVHGSWWYVAGSAVSVLICLVVLANSYTQDIGDDDSILPPNLYRLAWGLCLLSSVFFTVGSVAFIRACNDPPLTAMFSWVHFQSDELFGAWFFTMAILPAAPYCFIYLAVSQQSIYFIGLLVSITVLVGCFFIIRSLYPKRLKGEPSPSYVLKYIRVYWNYIKCCCPCSLTSRNKWDCLNYLEVHCATDFLCGTWLILWATFIGLVLFTALFLYEVSHHINRISFFVFVSSIFDGFLFLAGSVYFTAGAYPREFHLTTDVTRNDNLV